MSRLETLIRPVHTINATELSEPFLQVVVTPEGIKVHVRSERMRQHGFSLKDDTEARSLIEALQEARRLFATMPPSAGTIAVETVARMVNHNGIPA